MPLAFFCTLFFRHRKKSVSAPWDGQSQSAPESARQAPSMGNSLGKVVTHDASRVAFRSPPCTPFGSPTEAIERPIGLQALFPRRSRRVRPRQGEFLTAKLSPIDASRVAFRSPPCTPFGSPTEAIERPIGLQALLPRRNRRINPHQRGISSAEVSLCGTRRRHPSS